MSYYELNMKDVAHKCGISVGSVYNYFQSKGDLIVATIESIWTSNRTMFIKYLGGLLMQAIMETLFDVVYLTTVVTLGIIMIKNSKGNKQYTLFGIMAVVLGAGDSFHLIPRAIALCTTGLQNYIVPLGIGKFITSITMTVFYILLYYVWRKRYNISGKQSVTITVYLLAAMRIILCLFPQNAWTNANPSLSWGIYRNIPFALMGLLIIILFYKSAKEYNDKSFRFMWLTIVLSFAFYIPVVLWADVSPLIGMLMIPKTCAYVWTVWIGYSDMKNDQKGVNA
ncbi:MAG: TetR/AcrR family transcriptional regulator [Tissierellia bacterium]|nr:TetR/AcrR family transcriptional regulator [Tissierellia bacterium]